MKILYLSACGQIGGAERSLLDMLASVRASNPSYSLHLVCTENGPLVSECRALGAATTIVKLPRGLARIGDAAAGGPAGKLRSRSLILLDLIKAAPALIKYVRALRCAIRASAPDVIHSNGFKMHVLATLASRGIPVVWHTHDYVSPRPMMARLLKFCSRGCAMAVANSEAVAADVRRLCGTRLEVRRIYNAVDLESFSPLGSTLDLDSLAGLPPAKTGTIRVGMAGTFARWKGHETFLRAMAMLPANLPVRGYVIGDALYQTNGSQHSLEELKALANEAGVSDRVGFTGFVNDAAAAMRALDIVVHASTEREPFGLVIAEAMACGKPVVFAEGAGAAELITRELDAIGHVAGDEGSLARAITRLAIDADLRASLGKAARVKAERSFDRTRLAAALIPLYRKLCSVGCQPAPVTRQAGSLSYELEI